MHRCPSHLRPYLKGEDNSEMRQYQILVQYQYFLKFHFHYQDIIPEKKSRSMVDAAILAQQHLLSKTKDMHIS